MAGKNDDLALTLLVADLDALADALAEQLRRRLRARHRQGRTATATA